MTGYKLTLSYLGKDFAGWQSQRVKHPTIQKTLELALERIWGERVVVHGAGRTDSGVHAFGQVASFVVAEKKLTRDKLKRAINGNLPSEVRVMKVQAVDKKFHARFDARGKLYEYRIWNEEVLPPFLLGRAWHFPAALNIREMRAAAKLIIGRKDFSSLASNSGVELHSKVRTLRSIKIFKKNGMITIKVDGAGFLYRMVRNITGLLLAVGRGKLAAEETTQIIKKKDRSVAPACAPAHGLYLVKVFYK